MKFSLNLTKFTKTTARKKARILVVKSEKRKGYKNSEGKGGEKKRRKKNLGLSFSIIVLRREATTLISLQCFGGTTHTKWKNKTKLPMR